MATTPRKKGDLTHAIRVPEIPGQSQGTGTVREVPAPAQATTNGNTLPAPSRRKK